MYIFFLYIHIQKAIINLVLMELESFLVRSKALVN